MSALGWQFVMSVAPVRTDPLPEFGVAIGVAICVSALVIGTWVFLRLSGAGDELRAMQEAASDPGGLRNVARGFGDSERLMAAWSVPVMLGALGVSASVTGAPHARIKGRPPMNDQA